MPARKSGNLTAPASLSGADTPARVPLARFPVDREILLTLGAIVTNQQMAGLLGDEREELTGRAVLAGIVLALVEILPQSQLHAVLIQWEIDAIKFAELLDLAGYDVNDPKVQNIIEA